jgi:hypothetical protein
MVFSIAASTSSSYRRARGSRFADGWSSTAAWAPGEDRRDRHAPALAHRQLVGGPLRRVLHPHGGERLGDAPAHIGALEPQVERPERHVLRHRRHEELVVGILEHEAHAAAKLVHG